MIGIIGKRYFLEKLLGHEKEHRTAYGTVNLHYGDNIVVVDRHHDDTPPHKLNHLAHIKALEEVGVKKILGVCSVGSLKKEIQPGSIVVPEDYVNLNPVPTFYNDTIKHTVPGMSTELQKALGYPKGVYLQATGPRYETKAEIKFYSTIADVIGMTMASEATLSKELGLEYACVCSVDNYANGIGEQLVDEMIGLNARKNSEKILEILKKTVKELE